jgi:hypothetical protein
MPKYTVAVERHYYYDVPVEADNEYEAREKVRDYEIEDLEPFETNAWFDFELGIDK